MPMIPETAVAMLACTRIGAVHSIVFGGFSPDSLKDRILDATCNLVITSDEGMRGGRKVPMKANIDKALLSTPSVQKTVVVKRTGGDIAWVEGRDVWYHEVMAQASADCPPEHMDAEDPAVHPLHLRLHRQTQGRAAHHRRLSATHGDHPQVHLRLSRRRHLLVYRRRGLGHRPFLHRLRPAGQRRHHR
jgi:hypothetical protein